MPLVVKSLLDPGRVHADTVLGGYPRIDLSDRREGPEQRPPGIEKKNFNVRRSVSHLSPWLIGMLFCVRHIYCSDRNAFSQPGRYKKNSGPEVAYGPA